MFKLVIAAFMLFAALFGSAQAETVLATHVVQAGEVLSQIKLNYGVTEDAIVQANPGMAGRCNARLGLCGADLLYAGETISIPLPATILNQDVVGGTVENAPRVQRTAAEQPVSSFAKERHAIDEEPTFPSKNIAVSEIAAMKNPLEKPSRMENIRTNLPLIVVSFEKAVRSVQPERLLAIIGIAVFCFASLLFALPSLVSMLKDDTDRRVQGKSVIPKQEQIPAAEAKAPEEPIEVLHNVPVGIFARFLSTTIPDERGNSVRVSNLESFLKKREHLNGVLIGDLIREGARNFQPCPV